MKNFKWVILKRIGVIVFINVLLILLIIIGTYQSEIRSLNKEEYPRKYQKNSKDASYYYKDDDSNSFNKGGGAVKLSNCLKKKVDLDNLPIDLQEDVKRLQDLFNGDPDYVSFVYEDIYTGLVLEYNASVKVFTASSIKAPAIIYLYEQASKGKISLNDNLMYTSNYYSPNGSGILKTKEFNTNYTIRELSDYVMKYSDNSAYAMLMDKIGRENIYNFWVSLGTKEIFKNNTIWGYMTGEDAIIFMEELYNFYLNNNEYGDQVMTLFQNSGWKYITDKNYSYNTASKSGFANGTINDVAIVFDENPYILAVFTTGGNNLEKTDVFFKEVSNLVGNFHSLYWQNKMNECSDIKQY